jgi:hypothetical protein
VKQTSLLETEKTIALRCPVGPQRLLAVVRQTGDPHGITDGNLLEIACRDCRAIVAKEQGKKPVLVVHAFNVLGELVESIITWE